MAVEAEFERDIPRGCTNVYIYQRTRQGRLMLAPMKLEWIEVGEMGGIEPSMIITDEDGFDILEAIAAALAKDGKIPDPSYAKGKLEATERHLQDLRAILKKKGVME